MTKEETIAILQKIKPTPRRADGKSTTHILETIALDMAIQAIEQEPCEDCISRQAVLDIVWFENKWLSDVGSYNYDTDIAYESIISRIYDLPPVHPNIKTGHWVMLDECVNSGYYCSECSKKVVKEGWSDTVKKIKFCPNCGAKMVEPHEGSDKE